MGAVTVVDGVDLKGGLQSLRERGHARSGAKMRGENIIGKTQISRRRDQEEEIYKGGIYI